MLLASLGDIGPGAVLGQDNGAGAGYRPLGGGCPLSAVLQGGAVLPLGGTEMGGGHHPGELGEASVDEHGGQGQPLPHGRAGPVKAEEGHVLAPYGEGGADALVQKVPREEVIQVGGCLPRLVQGGGQGHLLHGGLGFLPALFSEGVVLLNMVEAVGQRAVPFFLAHHVGMADDGRG